MWENADVAVNYVRLLAQSIFGNSFSINIEVIKPHIRSMDKFRAEGTSAGHLDQCPASSRPSFQVRSVCSGPFQWCFEHLQGQMDCTAFLCSLVPFITALTVECFPPVCNQIFCNPTYQFPLRTPCFLRTMVNFRLLKLLFFL